MTHAIHESLTPLAVDIDLLDPLPGNPRRGDVVAIAASLERFGQLKPIVVRPNGDGRFTILAGNHTTEAAKQLGWTRIAAVQDAGMDSAEATAFALYDNQVTDLGDYDQELLYESIVQVHEYFPELMEFLGWDEYEIAGLADDIDTAINVSETREAKGYVAPEVIVDVPELVRTAPSITPMAVRDDESDSGVRLVAPADVDNRATVIGGVGGATSQSPNAKRAAVQYTLVFDDTDQVTRWWDFVKFLRASSVYEGDTIAERLLNFLEAHGDF
jgi:hypothetical protein